MAVGFVNSLGLNFPLTVPYGGTGLATSVNPYGIVCAGTTSTGAYQQLTLGTGGQILRSNGAGALPSWEDNNSITTWKSAVIAASTVAYTVTYNNGTDGVGATLTNAGTQAVFSIDGVTPAVTDRVLIKDQAADLQNGIYVVTNAGSGATNWVLTRSSDYDEVGDILPGDVVFVTEGTVNAGQQYWQTETVVDVGTDAILFIEFAGTGVLSVAGTANRIVNSGTATNVVIDIAATYVGQTSITTLGTIATGVWNGTAVDVAHGGTGNTTFTAYSPIFAGTTATGVMQSISIGSAGDVLTSNGAGALASFQTPTGSLVYVSVAGTSQTAAKNRAYGLLNAAQVTLTLPASAGLAVGDLIEVEGFGAAGFIIQAVGSQVINAYGGRNTTAAGTVTTSDPLNTTSSAPGCSMMLRYVATDTFWMIENVGNFVFA